MRVAVVTLFPGMFSALTNYGITCRAVKNKLLTVSTWNPREFTHDPHQSVDDRPYGGGPGMVMMIDPLKAAIDAARSWLGENHKCCKVIFLSPQGQVLKQGKVAAFAASMENENLLLIAGRYEGIDERVVQMEVDEEWSIGDYVLSGGELAAMVFMDAIIRLLPSALNHTDSALEDSFTDNLLDYPHYTRSEIYKDKGVPEVLLSGNHEAIKQWRLEKSLTRTMQRRPDLLKNKIRF